MQYNSVEKAYVFDNLKILGILNSRVILEVKSSLIKLVDQGKYLSQNYSYYIAVYIRNCSLGEIIVPLYQEFTGCQACIINYYSYDLKKCYECPDGAKCPGGADMTVLPGYWREHDYTKVTREIINLQ